MNKKSKIYNTMINTLGVPSLRATVLSGKLARRPTEEAKDLLRWVGITEEQINEIFTPEA